MCGIVGILGKRPVAPLLVDALKRLEYRGYDSAGVATLENGLLARCRAEGKLVNLENSLADGHLKGHIGIGHTRWATHGVPSVANAHPQTSGGVSVVHNGIIENYREIKDELKARGRSFESETDTEVIAHLIDTHLASGETPVSAARLALKRLRGAFALAILFEGEDDLMIGARRGSPLAIGHGDGENYLGSDSIALSPFTNEITYLLDGDWTVITRNAIDIYDENDNLVLRPRQTSLTIAKMAEKGNHRHFMQKEIYEQAEVIGRTFDHYIDVKAGKVRHPEAMPFDFRKIGRIYLSACGTAYYAGLVAKYWFEKLARLPVDMDVASEFRYREMPLDQNGMALFISQSGETADTLASLRYCKAAGLPIASILNVAESTMARESAVIFPTLAGPEIGVASTKAFTCQLAALLSLALLAGVQRGTIDARSEAELVQAIAAIPDYIEQALQLEKSIDHLSKEIAKATDVLYLGRGTSFALALEGALKLKEISYIHAEGYAAGELKHGPIALIDENMPVVVIAPHDEIFEKTVSNMQEVAARGGRIILITDRTGMKSAGVDTMETIILPDMPSVITPLVYAVPIQLLAYHTAVFMGTDVDQPRNLAKSVTVE
ncbi:MAG: glutamine--fructose-6-phosphate transaminase (isomerizing) [Rhizobiales bacterium]|nr:glutamine--fructose-6-phosphate transaminase (isomerizing) [Hyphomicrobiales bacterium]